MNKLVAETAKKVLGERRASGYFLFALSSQLWLLWKARNLRSNILCRLMSHDKFDQLNRYEAKHYSQFGEDGIIGAIFQRVGATDKFCVEFGVGNGTECNTAYLVRKRGWSTLWMDALEGASEVIKRENITAENINQLFIKHNVPRTFDLLSIDVDYNTYWVWKAIEGFSPRVVVVEYNAFLPLTESLAVPYDPHGIWDGTTYYGASLLALTKLATEKGYTLVACDNSGNDAFFVRNDLKYNFLSRSIEEIYRPFKCGEVVNGRRTGHPLSDKQFVAV